MQEQDLENTNIPRILYKYREIDKFAEDILKEGIIYFATPNKLQNNDKNEKAYFIMSEGRSLTSLIMSEDGSLTSLIMSEDGSLARGEKLVVLTPKENTEYYIRRVFQYKEKENEENEENEEMPYGFLSLCESAKEKRMYSQYAANFSGICIGFEWQKFELVYAGSSPPVKNAPTKVAYLKQPLEIDKSNLSPADVLNIINTKHDSYAFEKEWRIHYWKGKFRSEKVRIAIKKIIFGYDASEENIFKVFDWVKDLQGTMFYKTGCPIDNVSEVKISKISRPEITSCS